MEGGDSYIPAIRDVLRRLGISTWIYYREKYLDAIYKGNERLGHLYIASIRILADMLYSRGVRELYIGYPIMLSQDNCNEYNTNIWWYRKIVLWILDIFSEYGIEVELGQRITQAKNAQYVETNIKTEEYIEGYIYARKHGRR